MLVATGPFQSPFTPEAGHAFDSSVPIPSRAARSRNRSAAGCAAGNARRLSGRTLDRLTKILRTFCGLDTVGMRRY